MNLNHRAIQWLHKNTRNNGFLNHHPVKNFDKGETEIDKVEIYLQAEKNGLEYHALRFFKSKKAIYVSTWLDKEMN